MRDFEENREEKIFAFGFVLVTDNHLLSGHICSSVSMS